jgi:hypothetical protein
MYDERMLDQTDEYSMNHDGNLGQQLLVSVIRSGAEMNTKK